MDVIKNADVVVEMGPEAGDGGGKVVARGTPEQVAVGKGHTARFLKAALGGGGVGAKAGRAVEAEG